jgi:hypothetical protein
MEITSLLNLNPTNKQEAESFASKLTEAVESGMINPLELHVKLNAMKKAIDDVQKNTREFVMREANKYHEKSFEAFTAKIEKSETGVKYDFTKCYDSEWQLAAQQEQEFAEQRKEREAFLKTLKAPLNMVTEDGEAITIYPPEKSSTSFIKVTLK